MADERNQKDVLCAVPRIIIYDIKYIWYAKYI